MLTGNARGVFDSERSAFDGLRLGIVKTDVRRRAGARPGAGRRATGTRPPHRGVEPDVHERLPEVRVVDGVAHGTLAGRVRDPPVEPHPVARLHPVLAEADRPSADEATVTRQQDPRIGRLAAELVDDIGRSAPVGVDEGSGRYGVRPVVVAPSPPSAARYHPATFSSSKISAPDTALRTPSRNAPSQSSRRSFSESYDARVRCPAGRGAQAAAR